jgi:hypothetical protein
VEHFSAKKSAKQRSGFAAHFGERGGQVRHYCFGEQVRS